MRNAKIVIVNYFAGMRAETKFFRTFIEALKGLELMQPYKIAPKEDSCTFQLTTEDYLKIVRLHHPEIVEHDVEEMTGDEADSWERFAYAIGFVNRYSHTDDQAMMVRRIGENDFIFYAEKSVNLGYTIHSMTDAYQLEEGEEPFTTDFHNAEETYYNFKMLERALMLETDEMATFSADGEVIISEKDRELLKNEGVRATETNFTDFIDKIDENGAVFMGYLNNHLYFC